MLREYRVYDLRRHRIVISHDAGEQPLVALELGYQVVAQLRFDAAHGLVFLGATKAAKSLRKAVRRSHEAVGPNRIVSARGAPDDVP